MCLNFFWRCLNPPSLTLRDFQPLMKRKLEKGRLDWAEFHRKPHVVRRLAHFRNVLDRERISPSFSGIRCATAGVSPNLAPLLRKVPTVANAARTCQHEMYEMCFTQVPPGHPVLTHSPARVRGTFQVSLTSCGAWGRTLGGWAVVGCVLRRLTSRKSDCTLFALAVLLATQPKSCNLSGCHS